VSVVEEGRQHALEDPGRPFSAMLLPQAMERKQRGKAPCGKSDGVAGALGRIAELQDAAQGAESGAQGQRGKMRGADGTLPPREHYVLQLHDLCMLVVDVIHNGIEIE
jgi:hypothetical protein